ncbi:concanavalin A-like lectin/glucanase domain-containing protein [Aspergillus multicolor]|uniref:glycoside hydrolase family 16 protein n=1 Tax=Aspergillus multicolor TaxID=41759 RepID=UPI003CCD561B
MKQLLTILSFLLSANAVPLASYSGEGLPDLSDLIDGLLPDHGSAPVSGSDSGHGSGPGSSSGSDSASGIIPPIIGYTLTWHDEFTSSSSPSYSEISHLPSSANWLFDLGTSYPAGAPAWGNNELQSYTTSPQNIRITEQNTLQIIPRLSAENGGQWTSARIETASTSFAAAAGGKLYIESRLRTGCAPTSQQKGIWPAFWALGESFRENPTYWPMASEWDFVEVINGEPRTYNTLHCGLDSNTGGPCNEYTGLTNGGVSWSGCEWHVVGFEVDRSSGAGWQGETLTWFLDGAQTHRVSGADVGIESVWETIAHRGHFLLLNVAVGGNWPGYPDGNTVDGEGVGLEVDYVRVWNAEGGFY